MGPLTLIVVLPLLGFLINGLFGPRLPRLLVALIACVLPAVAFAITVWLFIGVTAGAAPVTETLWKWVVLTDFDVDVSLYFDAMTAVMCLVITGVGTLIHIYSAGYMAHDKSFARYFAYLNLFLVFMLLLVLGKNLIVLFVGWEGVGLASYLLIGFWFEDPEKTAAGVKAFVVNRVGDTGFVIAAFLIYLYAGSLDFQAVNAWFSTNAVSPGVMTTIGLLLLLGACGKSAQIPLHVWLPDAMAGPTPVSALIHAATMVTAGVYLLARLNGFYLHAPGAMTVVAWIGAATAFLGATMGVTQFNLKKVLAYSTISQIGFMVMACGVGAFSVGMFHLVTHAFFKACLFLGAGAVLHALDGEEDMRNMGGLARRLPFTFITFLAGALALCGIPPFAGFFSKDEILWQAWSGQGGSPWLWLVGVTSSGLTAFYIFRAIYMTFFGTMRVPERLRSAIHEPPPSMSIVLAVLAVGSLVIGFIGLPGFLRDLLGVGAPFYAFLAPLFAPASAEHHAVTTEIALMAIAIVLALAGIFIAWRSYGRGGGPPPEREPAYGPIGRVVNQGYYFDAVYEGVFVRCADWLSASVLARGTETFVSRITLDLPARSARYASRLFAQLQTGNVQAYVFYVIVGLAVALFWGVTRA